MNNRKQKVFSMLDSLTQTELNEYIKERKLNINKQLLDMLEITSRQKPTNHLEAISEKINGNLTECINNQTKLGQAWVIAFVLECFYDKKYKIKDIQYYLKSIISQDETLKEYVYEIMKDF